MVLIFQKEEGKLKKNLGNFLKKNFKIKTVKLYHKIFENFAPDYYLQKGNKKKLVIFRNPPDFPKKELENLSKAISEGIVVYIAAYEGNNEKLMEELLTECEKHGIGVIKCSHINKFEIIQRSIYDYPQEKIIEGRIKIFISSKTGIPERDETHKILKRLKHQPICIERISTTKKLTEECLEWIDKSSFFIGIITPRITKIIVKEIRYALKKKKGSCLIFVDSKCSTNKSNKNIEKIIKFVSTKIRYNKFNTLSKFKKEVSNHIPTLISTNLK